MSASTHSGTHADAGRANHDDELHSHGDEHGHGSLRGYLIGFGLSVVLTAIPFWLVMADVLRNPLWTAITVAVLAGIQIIVHMIFFLHMTPKAEGGWSLMALLFTFIVLVITLSGSVWVMYHLNRNMMPISMDPTGEMSGIEDAERLGAPAGSGGMSDRGNAVQHGSTGGAGAQDAADTPAVPVTAPTAPKR